MIVVSLSLETKHVVAASVACVVAAIVVMPMVIALMARNRAVEATILYVILIGVEYLAIRAIAL